MAKPEPKGATVPGLCYLCGRPLDGSEPEDRDHVPPAQFFAKAIRRPYKVQLTVLPTHMACNASFNLDEHYFWHTLVPMGRGSIAGSAVWNKAVSDYHEGKNVPLVHEVLKQAVDEVPGLDIPTDKVAIMVNRPRVDRVIAKIVRGLYFIEHGSVLPQGIEMDTSLTPPTECPPQHYWDFDRVIWKSHGRHQGVFAYKHAICRDVGTGRRFHYWAMLIWNRIIVTAMHEVP